MPRKHLPSIAANYTLIHQIFQHHGITNKLDTNEDKIPYETDITIYNKTKVKTFEITITDNLLSHLIFLFSTIQVLVNTEGCVNTLQGECTIFYLDHKRDGRNQSSRDRFPCYYTPHHDRFVTSR